MALSTTPDWRWLTVREDNPWYPTMRIFRQQKYMQWASVFDQMAAELRKVVPANLPTRSVVIEAAPGELIDKITILEIKLKHITDPEKLRNVRTEMETLLAARDRTIIVSDSLRELTDELQSINEDLWDIEDEIRVCEQSNEFGAKFVHLARSVYKKNDHRAALKRKINVLLGSEIIEEKSYREGSPQLVGT